MEPLELSGPRPVQTPGRLDRDHSLSGVRGQHPFQLRDPCPRDRQGHRLFQQPAPLLTQTRFITFPGSTATITVAGSRATSNAMAASERTRPESSQLQLTTYQLTAPSPTPPGESEPPGSPASTCSHRAATRSSASSATRARPALPRRCRCAGSASNRDSAFASPGTDSGLDQKAVDVVGDELGRPGRAVVRHHRCACGHRLDQHHREGPRTARRGRRRRPRPGAACRSGVNPSSRTLEASPLLSIIFASRGRRGPSP